MAKKKYKVWISTWFDGKKIKSKKYAKEIIWQQ